MILRLTLATLLLATTVAGAQTTTYSSGQFAELNTASTNSDSRLSVTVLSGAYALAWENIDQRWAATGNEKLYVLRFRVRNDGSQVESINPKNLQILISDAQNRGFDEPLAFRLPGTTQSANTRLVQSQSIDIEVAFLIPADTRIASAYFANTRSGRGPQVQFSVSSEASLPRALSTDGVTVGPIVAAQQNTWYPLGVTDVRVNGVSVSDVPVLSYAPNDTTDIAVVNFDIRNRSDSDIRISRGMYRETSLTTTGGDRDLLGLLFKDIDRSTDFPLLPGTDVSLRGVFKIPKDAGIESVDIVEQIGRRGGELSRRYVVGISGGAPTLPSGSDTMLTGIAAQPVPSGIPTAVLASPPAGSGNNVVTLPSEELPNASIPDGVLEQEDLAVVTAADPMVLDDIPTMQPILVDIPDADYVVRLRDIKIFDGALETNGEYQLMVMHFRGQYGGFFMSTARDARREHVNAADSDSAGVRYPLSHITKLRTDFKDVKPLEIMAVVFILIERDSGSGEAREAFLQSQRSKISKMFYNEFSRNLNVDYASIDSSDRDNVVAAFRQSARIFSSQVNGLYEPNQIDDGADNDDVGPAVPFVWIHTDDASNPGVFSSLGSHRDEPAFSFPWPKPISVPLNIIVEGVLIPGVEIHTLRFEIDKE